MNIRRGLFRLWLAMTALWIAYWSWQRDLPCLLGIDFKGTKFWCADALVDPMGVYAKAAVLILGVPLLIGALGVVILWVGSGFRKTS
jgi:hypothetical protein